MEKRCIFAVSITKHYTMKTPIVDKEIVLEDSELILYSDPAETHEVERIKPDGVLVTFHEYGVCYKEEFKTWEELTDEELQLINNWLKPITFDPEKFTGFSKRNLQVIQNFLLYAGLEEHEQTAINYIAEDHVDGEDSPQAIRELALSSELIREDVEISNSMADGYDVYGNINGLIYAVHPTNEEATIFVYKLIKPQAEIEVEHRDEILDYCLAVKTKEDEVCLGDIFVHGKYVTLISEV